MTRLKVKHAANRQFRTEPQVILICYPVRLFFLLFFFSPIFIFFLQVNYVRNLALELPAKISMICTRSQSSPGKTKKEATSFRSGPKELTTSSRDTYSRGSRFRWRRTSVSRIPNARNYIRSGLHTDTGGLALQGR